MKTLYLKILEILEMIPELKYIDLNFGQLQEPQPPLTYPAALVDFNITSQDIDSLFQINTADISITLVFKPMGETNNIAPEDRRNAALEYLDVTDKLHKIVQGYKDNRFAAFTRLSVRDQQIRKALKTVVHRYETSWQEDISNS